MSFSFQWPRFSDQFHADAIEMLNAALNKGPKPPVIADKIEVVELEMGTQVCPSVSPRIITTCSSPPRVACQPPELEVRDIGDLTTEQFRGIFRLTYSGDAHLVLRTKVQVCAVPSFVPAIPPLRADSSFLYPPILKGHSGRSNPHFLLLRVIDIY
jgi:mitochondrial distribution and morphology protein 34